MESFKTHPDKVGFKDIYFSIISEFLFHNKHGIFWGADQLFSFWESKSGPCTLELALALQKADSGGSAWSSVQRQPI